MIHSVTTLCAVLQSLFLTDADQLAADCGLVQRARKLSGATLAQTCVFGWLSNPTASLDDLTEAASAAGVDLSPQALHYRLNDQAATFFEQLLCSALHYGCQASLDQALPILERFTGTYVFDTTDIRLPDTLAAEFPGHGGRTDTAGQAGAHLQVCLEISGAGLVDLQLAPARTGDLRFDLAHTDLPAGALRLADLGFADLELFAAYQQQGVYWLSRWHPTWLLSDQDGVQDQLSEYLRRQRADQLDVWVWVGQARLPARLVAVRLSQEAAARRRQAYRRKKERKGRSVSAAALALCDWDITLSNVPGTLLTVAELQAVRRLRWQVELLFKLFKSVGGVDRLRGQRRGRVLSELYAKLLGQVVQSWHLLVLVGDPVRWSWYRSSRRLQRQWLQVVAGLWAEVDALIRRLERLSRRLRRRGRKAQRRRRPSAWHTLIDPEVAAQCRNGRFSLF